MRHRVLLMGSVVAGLATLAVLPGLAPASFPGDNGLLAVERLPGGAGNDSRIVTMSARRGTQQRVAALSEAGSNPEWSPDGTRILFERARASGYGGELYDLRSDGSGLRRLTACVAPCVGDSEPAYSPDGQRIVFVRASGPVIAGSIPRRRSVMEANADGSGLREILTFDLLDDRRIPYDPQWSPDGRTLALTLMTDASIFGVDVGVFLVGLDGTGLRRLVPYTTYDPEWSPGGVRIAFTLARGASSLNRVELYSVRADGSGLRRITRSRSGQVSAEASWSPDGTSIAFVRRGRGQRGHADLYVGRADGSGVRRLTKTRYAETSPDWGSRPAAS